jgi:methionyl-tRNA formyltransferase
VIAPPVADAARELGIELAQPDDVNGERSRAQISAAAAGDGTVVVCAFGALIREPLLSEHEILNVHPSLLPRWRGAAPIERAIMAGDERTGVCIMRLTAGLDSGPVALTAGLSIDPGDTYGTLSPRLQELGGELLARALTEPVEFVEQSEDGVTYAEKITAEDRLLDPARTPAELERLVRALHPHIGARAALADGSMIGVQEAALSPGTAAGEPGLRAEQGRLLLGCSGGTLELLTVQPPGGRQMAAADFLRGRRGGDQGRL